MYYHITKHQNTSSYSGQATLAGMIIFLLVAGAIVFGLSEITLPQTRIAKINYDAKQSFYLAEAGVEDVAYRVTRGRKYSVSETVTLNGFAATVTTANVGNTRSITSQSDVSGAVRKAKVLLEPNGDEVSFYYGLQVGAGGITMGNDSQINGNVASSGDIIGSGVTQSTITGTAEAAGADKRIENITISQDAYADILKDCAVGNVASYVTSITNCSASSTRTLLDPPLPQNLPIASSQIDDWKTEAAAGGTLSGYTLSGAATLGPKKIAGNMTLNNGAVLTLTGTVWVTGSISMGNSVTVQLDPSYGAGSGMVLADGSIATGNTTTLSGSGNSGSFLTLLSTAGPGDAIEIGNTAAIPGAILYASNGTIEIGNGLQVSQITGYGIQLGNSATITYQTGLASTVFTSGPGAAYKVASWQEVQ